MAVIGKPSASEIAAANTAADGITPASPAPLMPSGLSGDGVSRWSISIDVGHLGDVRHQEVHERRVEQLAGLVVGHPLVQRAADALRHAAVDLALDDHRVDQVPAVVDHGVPEDLDLRRQRVGLDDHRVHAGGERRPLGRVEVLALEPRLLVLGDRRLARVADGELGRHLGRLVEGVAQRVGQHRDRAERDRRVGRAPDRHHAVDDLEVVLGRPRARRPRSAATFSRARVAARWIADPLITAAREANVPTAYGIRRVSPVTTSTSSKRYAEHVGRRSARRPSRGPGPGWSGRSRP